MFCSPLSGSDSVQSATLLCKNALFILFEIACFVTSPPPTQFGYIPHSPWPLPLCTGQLFCVDILPALFVLVATTLPCSRCMDILVMLWYDAGGQLSCANASFTLLASESLFLGTTTPSHFWPGCLPCSALLMVLEWIVQYGKEKAVFLFCFETHTCWCV